MSGKVLELFSHSTNQEGLDWKSIVTDQHCPFLNRTCIKIRKSQPDIAIGTCSVSHGKQEPDNIIICPHRFLERGQIFMDCIHLLSLHEPGNEIHRIGEVGIPGGNVDFMLASVRSGRVVDFVGIETQAVDTTGTVWPTRQRFLQSVGLEDTEGANSRKSYGMNWKMNGKTILIQLHHKVQTFENISKHLVLVLPTRFLEKMKEVFNFEHIHKPARIGDAMHFHAYGLEVQNANFRLSLQSRESTNATGIASCLGLYTDPNVELEKIVAVLQSRISEQTRIML